MSNDASIHSLGLVSAPAKKFVAAFLLALFASAAAFLISRLNRTSSDSLEAPQAGSAIDREIAAKIEALEAREREADKSVWAKEILAQECGRTFEALWDSLNAATNKLAIAASFPVGAVQFAQWVSPLNLPHGISVRAPGELGPVLSGESWRGFVEAQASAGWQLAQTEFRQIRFETDLAGLPQQSTFYFSGHLMNALNSERAILEGDLFIDWAQKSSRQEFWPVTRIDASRLTIKMRQGETPFQPILLEQVAPPEKASLIDPLILYDLDGDGLSEIILGAKNLVYRRHDGNRYGAQPLCRHPPGPIFSCVVADFDGDGAADFLCAKPEGLVLVPGSDRGAFDQPGRLVWQASAPLKNALVLTCGDIDHDGDLDVFLGQYKVPTLGQILRPNFYDANDGHPAYLLLNGGRGDFTDATADSGLGKKRGRRIFSASFADLDSDGHLDLLVVSDFAGADLYRNDGHGHFTDVSREWTEDSQAFGMAHALADFNADGRLDFLMIGMNSPAADRLGRLGLTRSSSTRDRTMRSRMTFGNRLFLGRATAGFEQTSLNDSIARSGWSWGCSAFDFDNDGFTDAYIANGHESKQSVRDYDPEFWLHDIYVDDSVDDIAATRYFTDKFARTRDQGWSYGGYEKNRLYLNQSGGSFIEIGHLMGVALEQDSRNVVADDLDGDGRMDLLVTTLEVWPEVKQSLRAYRNTLSDAGNWIGFRFREEPGHSPAGVRVTVHHGGHNTVRQLVTGDSFRSQHANTLHFGLGKVGRVERVEIRWPDGRVLTLNAPEANRYHFVPAPNKSSL